MIQVWLELPQNCQCCSASISDVFQFDAFSETFPECQGVDREHLLESAEQTLQDVVYLEPILPDGESVVRAVNKVVLCMRDYACVSNRTAL